MLVKDPSDLFCGHLVFARCRYPARSVHVLCVQAATRGTVRTLDHERPLTLELRDLRPAGPDTSLSGEVETVGFKTFDQRMLGGRGFQDVG
jgi:hypothetical protein